MNWQKWLLAVLIFVFHSQGLAQAFTPTPAQIQQFKNMSPAQQQQMAKAAGIDLGAMGIKLPGNNTAQPKINDSSDENTELDSTDASSDTSILTPTDPPTEDKDQSLEDTEQGIPALFGHNLFRNNFRPATNVPVPADYILGPGDTLVVQLYGKDNSSHSLVVNREGQIQFPQIGPVTFAGLSFFQAQELISETVKEQMIGIKASVTMGALRSIRIFVLGEVARPGSFTVGSLSTMTNALFTSGGISRVGSLRDIQLKRRGKIVTSFDLYDLLLSGDTSGDSRLLPGDVIFVPPIGKTVSITGAVKRPATYEIKGHVTTGKVISLAGGLKNTSHLPISYLVRYDEFGEKTLINIDLSTTKGQAYLLNDGDILSIASKLDLINNQVILSGHVKRPGPRSWGNNLRFTDLIPTPLELLPNPDVDMALIQRFSVETRRVEVILFSPNEAWVTPGSKANPILQPFDVVQIFNYETQRSDQLADVVTQLSAQSKFKERKKVVSISGSIQYPGRYPLAKNMTTLQLIQLAGGLTESAIDTNGEITRYSIDENRQRIVSHINVDFNIEPTLLEAGDSLQIKQVPLWADKETVSVTGEVMYPGIYTILPGETLTQVISRAGGFTPHAYPIGAIFSRKALRTLEEQRLRELKQQLESDIAASKANGDQAGQSEIDAEGVELLMKNLDSINPIGRMVINLPNIIDTPGKNDLSMEDGDAIVIPRYKPSVTVVGEVQYPTSHFFEGPLGALEYIDRSGGYKKHADEARVYIVKANGSVILPETSTWFKANNETIQAGDTIVVPLETDKVNHLTIWASVTQIIYQAALGVAAINGL